MCELENCDTGNLQATWPASQYNEWINGAGESNLVSVIIPTYNRADLIEETLDSVWEQHYRPIEIIVVDDGSEDNTASVVRSWTKQISSDDKLSIAYHRQENQGVASARNRGVKEARGAYIQLLDSDDKLHPRKLSTQVQALRSHLTAKYVYCLTSRFGNEEDESRMGYDISKYGLRRALVEHPYQTSAALYDRDLVRRAGPFGRNLTPVDDWEFAIRAYIAAGGALVYQNEAYNHQRDSSHERLTGQGKAFHEGRLRAMCHNKKVLESTGLLNDPHISNPVSLNFIRIALLLHDLGASNEVVRRALREAYSTSSGMINVFSEILLSLHKYEGAFGITKKAIRRAKYIKEAMRIRW